MVVTCFSSYYEKFADGKVICIDEEIPFEIPSTWEWCRLGCMCDYLHRGKSPKYGTAQVLPIIAQKCNQWDKIYTDRCLFSDLSFIDKYTEEQYLQKGDIIINSTGGGTVGRTGIIEDYLFEKYPKYVADSHVTVVRGNILLIPRFIYYYLISPVIQTGIEERCSGSTNQIELGTSTIYNYLIPVPPYKEQLRIIELMQVILQKVEKYGIEQEKLENLSKLLPIHLKKSILQEAIQGRLVPQDPNDEPASILLQRIREEKLRLAKEGKLKKKDVVDSTIFRGDDNKYYEKVGKNVVDVTEEIPFEIPESWEWCHLGSFCELIGGYAFPSESLKGNTGIRVIRISDISESGFVNNRIVRYNGKETLSTYNIRVGDILIAMTGGTVGKSLYVTDMPEEILLNQRVAIIRNEFMNKEYINYVIRSPYIKDVINEKKNSTNDNISMKDIYNFFIPVPSIEEQKRIVMSIEQILKEIKGN